MKRLLPGLRQLFSRPSSAIGVSLSLLFLGMALFGPLIEPYEANQQVIEDARQGTSAG